MQTIQLNRGPFNTYTHILLILVLLFSQTSAIIQRCKPKSQHLLQMLNQDDPCPLNSYCSSNGYCVCRQGYIGDCSTQAYYLRQNDGRPFIINQNLSYFILPPQTIGAKITYQFQICNKQVGSTQYSLTIWIDDGKMITPTKDNQWTKSLEFRLSNACIVQYITYTTINQPNGQAQYIFIGLKTMNPENNQVTITLKQHIQNDSPTIKIIIIISCVLLVALIAFGIRHLYKKKKMNLKNLTQVSDSVKFKTYFNDLMPQIKVSKGDYKDIHCIVCLGDFTPNQKIRKTVCGHVFHSTCLDDYCQQNLSCPICKFALDKQSILSLISQKSSQKSMITLDENTMNERLIDKYQESSQKMN